MSDEGRVEISPAEWRREKEKQSKDKDHMKNDAEQRTALTQPAINDIKTKKEHKRFDFIVASPFDIHIFFLCEDFSFSFSFNHVFVCVSLLNLSLNVLYNVIFL